MKKAFTLAEVLITLGVIGVVAALTIPQISRYYKSVILQSQLKENYSIISQAIKLYYEETGETLGNTNSDDDGRQRQAALMKYIKHSKDCGYRKLNTACTLGGQAIRNDYMNLTGTTLGPNHMLFSRQQGQFITNKNALIAVSASNEVYLDVNGYKKQPNQLGLDVFIFVIDDKNNLTCQTLDQYSCYYPQDNGKKDPTRYKYYFNGFSCGYHALNDDYWRAVRKFL